MASTDTPVTDNPTVSRAATRPDALRLDTTTLIGIVGPTATPSALLRLKNGRILKLDVGDDSPAGVVIGIDAQSVSLALHGRMTRLRLP